LAELIIKIDDGAGYADGDIIAAFNDRETKRQHGQRLAHRQNFGFKANGLRPEGLAEEALDILYQYKFVRVSEHEAIRTEWDIDGNIIAQNLISQGWDLPEHLRRRRLHGRHRIFGEDGAARWHGGRSDFSADAISLLWGAIEHHTARRMNESAFAYYGLGYQDVRSHLAIPIEDIDDEEVERSVRPQLDLDGNGDPVLDGDGKPIQVGKRALNISVAQEIVPTLQIPESTIRDKRVAIDIRLETPNRNERAKVYDRERGGPTPGRNKDRPEPPPVSPRRKQYPSPLPGIL